MSTKVESIWDNNNKNGGEPRFGGFRQWEGRVCFSVFPNDLTNLRNS